MNKNHKIFVLPVFLFFLYLVNHIAVADPFVARTIELSPEPGGIYDYHEEPQNDGVPHVATGRLTIIPPGTTSQPFVYLHFSIQQLPQTNANGRDFFTLYLESPSNGKVRVLSFNTGGTDWGFSSDLGFAQGSIQAWLSEPLKATITHESDDGYDGHIGSGSYVLFGETNL